MFLKYVLATAIERVVIAEFSACFLFFFLFFLSIPRRAAVTCVLNYFLPPPGPLYLLRCRVPTHAIYLSSLRVYGLRFARVSVPYSSIPPRSTTRSTRAFFARDDRFTRFGHFYFFFFITEYFFFSFRSFNTIKSVRGDFDCFRIMMWSNRTMHHYEINCSLLIGFRSSSPLSAHRMGRIHTLVYWFR